MGRKRELFCGRGVLSRIRRLRFNADILRVEDCALAFGPNRREINTLSAPSGPRWSPQGMLNVASDNRCSRPGHRRRGDQV